MSPSPILVTGASGFLASHVILQLLQAGHTVRGSVRTQAKGDHIRAVLQSHGADTTKLEFVELDLTKDDGWAGAMAGVHYLIHTASPFVTYIPDDEDELIRPAVEGTQRALNAALAAGVKRIVLTSSEVATARGHGKGNEGPFDESDWSNLDGADMTPYFKSKTLAEREAWRIMEQAGRKDDLSVVNPGFILGPLLEEDAGTSGGLIAKMMNGKLPGAPDVYLGCVDVRDAAELHVRAIDDSRGFGRRIFAANDAISFGEVADILAQSFPEYAAKLPTRRLPNFIVRLVALVNKDARGSVPILGVKYSLVHVLAAEILGQNLTPAKDAVIAMGQSLIDYKKV